MIDRQSIVAVGLLSQSDLLLLGSAYRSAIPIHEIPAFEDLLLAIDEAQARGSGISAR